MNKYGLTFHHLGLATQDAETAKRFLSGMGYSVGSTCYDPLQRVNLNLCVCDSQPDVELITQADTDGPLETYLKNTTALLYHTCYVSKDVEASLKELKNDGMRVVPISPAKPAVLFDNTPVSFYMIKAVGLIEIIHNER